MRAPAISSAIVLLISVSQGQAASVDAQSKLVSVGLFKNGLAVVRRTFTAATPGTYEITDVPEPVHGTFWVESNVVVDTRITSREVEEERDISDAADFQRDLAGQKVTLRFREPTMPGVSGVVVKLADDKPMSWRRDYATPQYGYGYSPGEATRQMLGRADT